MTPSLKASIAYKGLSVASSHRGIFTRAQYARGLCVCVCLYVCVCGQKTRLFTSHRSKFGTKVHFAASSLNL